VRIEAAAVSHLDVTIASGTFAVIPTLPHIGGTDGVGEVLESDEFAMGTKVLIRGGGIGLKRDGCWAEYAVVGDSALTAVDDRLEPSVAATFLVPCTTGYVAVKDITAIAPGERVLVSGAAGAVGSIASQFAMRAGAANVTGIVSTGSKAQRLPAGVQPIVGSAEAVTSQLNSLRKFDVLIDTVGGPNLPSLLERVTPGGRAALVGYTHGSNVTLHLPNFLMSDVKILPVNMIRRAKEQAALAPLMSEMIIAGELVSPVQEFPLTEISEALEALGSGQLTGRAVLVPNALPTHR
jgi:NADPH2:quinone reductase